MTTNAATPGLTAALIERFEGIELNAYLDPVGVPTICAGITYYPDGSGVRMGDVCTAGVCRGHLTELLAKDFLPKLERIPGWAKLPAVRQAVLGSFAWNMGAAFYGSTGFETITQVLKDGATDHTAYSRLPKALMLYVNAGGRRLEGLVKRRADEGTLWSKVAYGQVILVAKQDTWLKVAPIDGKYLSTEGKRPVVEGGTLKITKLEEIPRDAHCWVTLEGSQDRWAIFMPHFSRVEEKPALAPAKPAIGSSPVDAINWSDFNAKVGKYITVGEVLQMDGRRKPRHGSAEEKAIIAICREFDKIRESWNGPLGITSGYRPEPINREVGGVQNSYHVKGMALDIYPIGASLEEFYSWLIRRWSGGFGDGRSKGFIHIDTRDNGFFSVRPDQKPVAVWDY